LDVLDTGSISYFVLSRDTAEKTAKLRDAFRNDHAHMNACRGTLEPPAAEQARARRLAAPGLRSVTRIRW